VLFVVFDIYYDYSFSFSFSFFLWPECGRVFSFFLFSFLFVTGFLVVQFSIILSPVSSPPLPFYIGGLCCCLSCKRRENPRGYFSFFFSYKTNEILEKKIVTYVSFTHEDIYDDRGEPPSSKCLHTREPKKKAKQKQKIRGKKKKNTAVWSSTPHHNKQQYSVHTFFDLFF